MKNILEKYKNMNVMVKASIWFTICSIIQKGISVITLPIFTRIMSIEQYGEYNVFLTWYNIILIIISFNIQSEVFNKGLSEHKDSMSKYTNNQIGLMIILLFIYTIIYVLFRNFINNILHLSTFMMFLIIIEIFCSTIIEFWRSQKKFEYNYKKIVVISLLCTVFSPIIGIIAVLNTPYKVEAKIISNILIPLICSVVILISYLKNNKISYNTKIWKKTLFLALPLLPHYLSLVLLNQSDRLMINYFIGSASAAIYSVAYSAGFLLIIINNSINSSIVPWLYERIKNKNLVSINKIVSGLFYIVAAVNLFLIWLAPECISIFAPSSYQSAIWCLIPISISVFFSFVYSICVDLEVFFEKNIYITISTIISTILNLVLNLIFIPRYGFISAAYTTLFSYFILMILHLIFTSKVLKNNSISIKTIISNNTIIICSLILCIGAIIAAFLYNYMVIRIVLLFIVSIVIIIFRKKIIDYLKAIKKNKRGV